ncbi:MAG: hypothetical protein AAGM45_09095 [Cyanobacteria bacterium J06588_5]
MPFTYKGIGTTYYGKRDVAEDGSYITTEWVVFVYLPILPLRSYRVRPAGSGTGAGIFYRSQQYMVKKVDYCWPQIRNAYLVTGAIAATALGAYAIAEHAEAEQSSRNALPPAALTANAHARFEQPDGSMFL